MVWVVVVIAAVVFLCWFGNYTSAMYRRMYGTLPPVAQQPKRIYGAEKPMPREIPSFYSCSSAVVSSCCTSVVSPYVGNIMIRR